MDLIFIILVSLTFIVLLMLKLSPTWVILFTVLAALGYLSFRYPEGRRNWKYDTRQTIYTLTTILSLCILGALVYKVSESLIFPSALTLVLAATGLVIAFLTVLSLWLPEGRLRSTK